MSGANQLAVARIDVPQNWPNNKLMLIGPTGVGKTHLAHVWATAQGAQFAKPDTPPPPVGASVVVDDADTWAGQEGETALFHLHNHVLANGGFLLLTASLPPARWSIQLPDLASRMLATDNVAIDEPDDALLAALLVKLFDDRQIAISPTLIDYIVPRMTRSASAALDLVERLDRAALDAKKPITRAFAAQILDKPPEDKVE